MTLVSDVIEVPDIVLAGDYVLDLTQGVSQIERTLTDYVVTDELKARFGEALALISSALRSRSSKAAYLDGSFGSGKSHFMAVLGALLQNHPAARGKEDLAEVIAKYDGEVIGRKFLIVPYHLVGKTTVEEAVLSGYLARVRALHPEAPLPPVLVDAPLIDTAVSLRARLGDAEFFRMLGGGTQGGGSRWGSLNANAWDAARFDEAVNASPEAPARAQLVAAVGKALPGFADLARNATTSYINIDDGLAAISQHAHSLGYDGLVLFLDELILWFATKMADHKWVASEAPKVAKLVESSNPNRPIPIVSFVARQRDLRDLVGTSLPGTEHLAFHDSLKWWEGRFGSIKLSDNNLPVIIQKRVLRPRPDVPGAVVTINASFAATDQVRADIRAALMTKDADRDAFRRTYPFSPAFVETLVALSGYLQRERTALRVIQQLLVDQRATLELGQLVPVSDLYDALVAQDSPITGELALAWRNAQKVYEELRRVILEGHQVTEEQVPALPARHAVHMEDRVAKTLVLAALLPKVPSMRDLTARRIGALNHGHIRSMVPGQEAAVVTQAVRRWVTSGAPAQLTGDEVSPLLSVRLEGVSIEGILERAKGADSPGERRVKARGLLFEGLDTKAAKLDGASPLTVLWRGTRRSIDVIYGYLSDPGDIGDGTLMATDNWRVAFDIPFDPGNRLAVDSLDRLRRLREQRQSKTICWVPSRLTAATQRTLGRYLKLGYASGPSFDQLALDLSDNDRAIAHQQLVAHRDELRAQLSTALLQAFGLLTAEEAVVDTAHGGVEMFFSLEPAFEPRRPGGVTVREGIEGLLDQALSWEFPAHPRFPSEVRASELAKVHAQVRRAIEHPEHRIMVESADRSSMAKIANPLLLGEQGSQYFVLGHHWADHLGRRTVEEEAAGKPVTVGHLRNWLDDPKPMGLLPEHADLVVQVFVEQTNRALVHQHEPVDLTNLHRLPADARVVAEPLPSEEAWTEARSRALAIFGISGVSEMRTARNVAMLATQIRQAADAQGTRLRELREALLAQGRVVLPAATEPASTERVRIATDTLRLCETLTRIGDNLLLIDELATYTLPANEAHLRRGLDNAPRILRSIGATQWAYFEIVTTWGPEHSLGDQARALVTDLATVWGANEFVHPLSPAVDQADKRARELFTASNKLTYNPPADPGGGEEKIHPVVTDGGGGTVLVATALPAQGTRIVDQASLAKLTADLVELAAGGRRISLTWQVLE
ncbi:hypothetical protein [Pseudofrankia asymbiotica]|uniref:Phage resistance protein n=1 Tax=Pseudofrankia asymbiotica TaxID=1834516 RepID=A0A1V2I0N2_9ACTN|nr:hypothetical protein [Pseudofrankia asymbiotica]ONH22655.1 hypothetical protein BL253_35135 [Pseudofrankia asymbiotica]